MNSIVGERPVRAGELRFPARATPATVSRHFGPLPGGVFFALGVALSTVGMTPVIARAGIDAGFRDSTFTVAPGDTFTAYLVIRRAGVPFNAFDASVRFDPAMLSFDSNPPVSDPRGAVMVSACANLFHRFEAAPDSLRITLSLLCSKTSVTGPGLVYGVRFRASPTPGITTISLGSFTEFYRAGLFVRPLEKRSMVVTIGRVAGLR